MSYICSSDSLCEHCKHEKHITKHIRCEYLERMEDVRHTPKYKALYDKCKEMIERVFADAKKNTQCVIQTSEAYLR